MKQMKIAAEAEQRPRPVRRRRTAKVKSPANTLQMNREGEWIGSDELRTYLMEAPAETEIALDMAGLTHVDAACFQVLVSAALSGLFADGRARLVHASESVRDCFQYSGAEMLLASAQEIS